MNGKDHHLGALWLRWWWSARATWEDDREGTPSSSLHGERVTEGERRVLGGKSMASIEVLNRLGIELLYCTSMLMRAVGAFGGFNTQARPVIFVPYLKPAAEFTLLVSDWWKADHKALRQRLDSGKALPKPDGLLINGSPRATSFTGQAVYECMKLNHLRRRTIDISEKDGCLLESVNENPRFDLRKSVSIPISVIDSL
ncbi:hypothetical protein L1987_43333 [Smallanthus sonchifolius]|uniref:Uncharacterized protein n=1 Tax=Smallanthus sonchifolius TaxID=185202 RepID=A0ACB9GL46_9ASTR|nr:hypothetical protein L1987_43333 [Smallanthus sonchifolius]